jgi:hypothetical protein
LNQPELSWRLWMTMVALDWRWPIDVVLRQPEDLMNDVTLIEMLARRLRAQFKRNKA